MRKPQPAAGFEIGSIEPLFCAPTAAATDVLRKEGFEAKTLQSLLLTKPVLSARQLVVLDEAGAVGMDDMKRLFDFGKDCRIVLSGYTGQHASVARGDPRRPVRQAQCRPRRRFMAKWE
jgi:ATP-dependent exoDNAse (exonuclease V) alpha subunit